MTALAPITLTVVALLVCCSALSDPREAISARLLLMGEVAKAKWNTGAAVEDPEREQVVLAATVRQAVAQGVAPDYADRAVRAQIEASKAIQATMHRHWRATDRAPFDDARSLENDLRPAISARTAELIESLRAIDCAQWRHLLEPPAALAEHAAAWRTAIEGARPEGC